MKKMIAIILCLSLLLTAAGCKEQNPKEKVVLASFETYDEVAMHSMSLHFGKISIQKEEEFVTEGESSLKIEPVGDYETPIMPVFEIHTDVDAFALSDFSEISLLTFDIYNAAEDYKTIDVTILGRDNGQEFALPELEVRLAPRSWNIVSYDFSDGTILKGNPGIKDITRINIGFEDFRTTGGDYTADVYYLDNIVGIFGEVEDFAPPRAADEILNFESLGDLKVLGVQGEISLSNETSPLKVGQGKMSLKAEGSGTITVYLDNLLTDAQREKNSVSLDVMNEMSIGGNYTFTIAFKDETVSAGVVRVREECFIGAYGWQTFSFDTADFPEGKTLADVSYVSVEIPTGTTYLDAIRVI